MAEDDKRRGGGAKPTRTETITVRLDPKLKYLAELAARKQRRTLSSYIEWAVEQSLKEVKLYEGTGYNGDDSVTVAEEVVSLWDVDDAERFVKLAIKYPALLTHEEQERWKTLHDSSMLAPARSRQVRSGLVQWDWSVLEDQVLPALRLHWSDLLQAQSSGPAAREAWIRAIRKQLESGDIYPGWKPPAAASKPRSSSGFDEMDDDIPF